MPHRLQPTELEVACGMMLGPDTVAQPLAEEEHTSSPLAAFEAALLPALRRPPCLVSFSGGRDSSANLAVAVNAARREGLPLPVPVTVRFRAAPGASEPEWQELVVRHLRLDDWLVLEVDDELDLVGPVARRVLRRHGVVYPAHSALYAFMLEQAQGGSLLIGVGGDRMLGGWRYRPLADLLRGRRFPRTRDLALAGSALAPLPARRLLRRRRAPQLPWLRPQAQRRYADAWTSGVAHEARWSSHLVSRLRARSLAAYLWTISRLAEDAAVLLAAPFSHPRFVAALARAGGSKGLGGRTAVTRLVFGGLLPEAVISRPDKARFPYAYFRTPSTEFARSWSGEGLDPELVDADAIRVAWLSLLPNGSSALPLQAAWLASAGGEIEEAARCVVDELDSPRTA
jgi:asparagine synthetase B (glutamine-hydrolysing)